MTTKRLPKELVDLAQRLTLNSVNLAIAKDSAQYPWFILEFQRQLQALEKRKELLLPNLRDENESIAVFSDYSGESADSKYLTYSFLVCAWNQTGLFHEQMAELRKSTGLNNPLKEIAFKDFRYGPIQRALPEYLKNLSNSVNGLLLTVVIEKAAGSLFGVEKRITQHEIVKAMAESGFGVWKADVAEKILRICHFSAYLVALLSRKGQKVIWMTDHDAIAASNDKFMEVLNYFCSALNLYSPHEFSTIGGALPFEERSVEFLDLLSAPDISAGSVAHYFNRSLGNKVEPSMKNEASRVLDWLSGQGMALKRYTTIIRCEGTDLVSATLKYVRSHEDPNDVFIPVTVN